MTKYSILKKLHDYISIKNLRKISNFNKHYFGGLYQRADDHHIFLTGSGIAFSIFITTIPITLILFAILGNILDASSIELQVKKFIEAVIPYKDYADRAEKLIISITLEVIEYKKIAGLLGAVGLIFTASSLFSSLRTMLNRIFKVKQEKHPLIGKLRDLAMILLVIITVLLATFLLPILNLINQLTQNIELLKILQISTVLETVLSYASIFIIFIVFFLLYYLIPYENMGKRAPFIGALWAAVLWLAVSKLFGYYLTHIATLNKIYGTYALIVVIAFWLYYSSILFLIGAEIGQLHRERRKELNRKGKK